MVKKSNALLENTIESGNVNVNNISDNNPLKQEVEQVYDGDKRTNEVSNEAVNKATPEQKDEVINSRWDRWDRSDNKFLNRYSGHEIFEGMSDEDLDDYENNVKDNKSLNEFVDRYNNKRKAELEDKFEKARSAYLAKRDWRDNNKETYDNMSDVDRAAFDKELDKLWKKSYDAKYKEPSDRLYNYQSHFGRYIPAWRDMKELWVPDEFNNWKEYKAARDKDEADYNRVTNTPGIKNLIDTGFLTVEKNSPKNYGTGYDDLGDEIEEDINGDAIFGRIKRALYNGDITPEQWKKEFGDFRDKLQAEADELNRKYRKKKPTSEQVEDWNNYVNARRDEFFDALLGGNTKKAEDIVEENPEVASALPDDVPLKDEAEQLTDDNKRNDEVRDEAVEETAERLSNDFETVDDLMEYVESLDMDKGSVGDFLKEERKGMLGDGGSDGGSDETVVDEAIDSMEDELEDDVDVNSDIPDSDRLENEEVEELERQLDEDNDDNVEEEGEEEPFKEDIPGEEDADDNGIPDDDDPLFKEDVFDDPYDFYLGMKGAERESAKKAMRDDAKYKPINPADLIAGLDFTDEEKEIARENIREDLKEGKNGKIYKTLDMFHKSHIWELSDEEKEILKRTILEESFDMPNLSMLGSRPSGSTGSLVSGNGGTGSGSDLRTSSTYRASSTPHSSGPSMGLPSGALGFSSPHASGSGSPRSMYGGRQARRAGGGSIPNNNVSSGGGNVIRGHQSKSSGFVTNNGAVSSGATQTRSTLARPTPKADLPSFFGHTDMSGAGGLGSGSGSGRGNLKEALIERIHVMLSSLPPEVVKEMGFSPVNHLYKGTRLEALDGETLSELSQELESNSL